MHISIGCMCKDEGKLIVTSALPLCLPCRHDHSVSSSNTYGRINKLPCNGGTPVKLNPVSELRLSSVIYCFSILLAGDVAKSFLLSHTYRQLSERNFLWFVCLFIAFDFLFEKKYITAALKSQLIFFNVLLIFFILRYYCVNTSMAFNT